LTVELLVVVLGISAGFEKSSKMLTAALAVVANPATPNTTIKATITTLATRHAPRATPRRQAGPPASDRQVSSALILLVIVFIPVSMCALHFFMGLTPVMQSNNKV
jgi:hypothetical protein